MPFLLKNMFPNLVVFSLYTKTNYLKSYSTQTYHHLKRKVSLYTDLEKILGI